MAQRNAQSGSVTMPPEFDNCIDLMLYNQIYYLCRDFDNKKVDRQTAAQLKSKYVGEYNNIVLSRRVYSDHMKRMAAISQLLAAAEHSGCPYCEKVSKIFDGRENND